jgi:tetratricopeptide (TPR) repeat protein
MAASRPIRTHLLATWAFVLVLVPMAGQPAQASGRTLASTYQTMVEADPYDTYALRRLLEVSRESGGVSGLLSRYRERAEADPRDRVAWTLIGHLSRSLEEHAGAVEAFARAAALSPKDPRPWLATAGIWRQAQRWEPMLLAYDAALERTAGRDSRRTSLEEAAEAALDANRLPRALAWLEALRNLDPRSVISAMTAAEILTRYGRNEEALEAWTFAEGRARAAPSHRAVIWRHLGTLLEEMGRLEAAEDLWRRAMEKTPSRHWAQGLFLEGLARVYRRRDRLPALAEELRSIARRRPQVQGMLARIYDELGDDEQALSWLDKAIQRDRGDTDLHERRIALLRRRGDLAPLERAYERLVRAAPHEARYGLEWVAELLRRGHLGRGLKRLDRVVARHRRDPGVWQRAISLLGRHASGADRGRIMRAYKALMRLEPREPAHVVSLGEAVWASGDHAAALALWGRLTRLGTRPGAGHLLLAEVLADHQLEPAAREAFLAALAEAPEDASVLEAAARWLEDRPRAADRQRAMRLWSRLLELGADPSAHPRAAARREHARRHLVELWERNRSVSSRLAQLSARVAADPTNLPSGLLLVELYLHIGRLDQADRLLSALAERAPDNLEILRLRLSLLMRTHRLSEALPLLKRVAELDPRGAGAAIHRAAEVAHALGDFEGALELSEEALRLKPGDANAQLRAGEIRLRLGQRNRAAAAWREALRLSPRDDELRMRLAALYRDLDDPNREERVLLEVVRDASAPARVQRAGRRLLTLARQRGRLSVVERVLRPLAVAQGRRAPIHRRLLVDLYLDQAESLLWSTADTEGAADELARLGARGLEILLAALEGDDAALRARALRVLRLTRPLGAVPALGRILTQGDGASKFHAAITLGAIGGATSAHALGRVLTEGRSELQNAAIWALGGVAGDVARELLLARTATDQARHHTLAALALAHHPHGRTVEALSRLAGRSGTRPCLAALWALAMIQRDDTLPELAQALQSSVPVEARLAAWGLGRAGQDASRSILLDALVAGVGPPSHVLVRALVHRPTTSSGAAERPYDRLPDLTRGRVETDPAGIVAETIIGKAPAHDRASAVAFLEALERRYEVLGQGTDRSGATRAIEALAWRDTLRLPQAWSLLREDPVASRSWGKRLASPFVPMVVPILARVAADPDGIERSIPDAVFAIDFLTRLEYGESSSEHHGAIVAVLEALLSLPDAAVRASAWRVAARLAPQSVARLVGAFSPSDRARSGGSVGDAEHLAFVGAVGACPSQLSQIHLAVLLADDSARVRLAAASVVAPSHAGLSERLGDLLDDPVAEVARAAARALDLLDSDAGESELQRVRSEGDPRSLLWTETHEGGGRSPGAVLP